MKKSKNTAKLTVNGDKYYELLKKKLSPLRKKLIENMNLYCNQAVEKAYRTGDSDSLTKYMRNGIWGIYNQNYDYKNMSSYDLFFVSFAIFNHLNKFNPTKYQRPLDTANKYFELRCRVERLKELIKYMEEYLVKLRAQNSISVVSVTQHDEFSFYVEVDTHLQTNSIVTMGKLVTYYGNDPYEKIPVFNSISKLRISTHCYSNPKDPVMGNGYYSFTIIDPSFESNTSSELILEQPLIGGQKHE